MKELQKTLEAFSDKELCEIYENLNNWRWDERLGKAPKGFKEMPVYRKGIGPSKDKCVTPYIKAIEKRWSKKENQSAPSLLKIAFVSIVASIVSSVFVLLLH